MKKFLVTYHAPAKVMARDKNMSSEEKKKTMGPWKEWVKKLGPALVDLGSPVGNGQKVSKSGSAVSDKGIIGYSILEAGNIEKAKEMLKSNPFLDRDGACELAVHELFPMPALS